MGTNFLGRLDIVAINDDGRQRQTGLLRRRGAPRGVVVGIIPRRLLQPELEAYSADYGQ